MSVQPNRESQNPEAATASVGDKPSKVVELLTVESAQEYMTWKASVPIEVRQAVEGAMKESMEKSSTDSLPLVGQFLQQLKQSLISGNSSSEVSGIDVRVANMLKPLSSVKTKTGGVINIFKVLADPDTSWALRRTIYDIQIKPALEWLAEKDLEDAKKQLPLPSEEKQKESHGSEPSNTDLPDQSEEARSSMEAGMEKGENEPTAIFVVAPYFGGYYRQQIMDTFDSGTGRWSINRPKELSVPKESSIDNLRARIISGKVKGGGRPLALPLPYNWAVDTRSLECGASGAQIVRDREGLWYLKIAETGVFDYTVKIGPQQVTEEEFPSKNMDIAGSLSRDITGALTKITSEHKITMKRAREIVKAVRAHLKYSNSPDIWQKYMANPDSFFETVWQLKEADCFVSNTLAVRLLKEAGIISRFISGHYVKAKNEHGQAVMHGGSGHAWLEVWDSQSASWTRMDATPKGDPTVDEDVQEQDLKDEPEEGDYGDDEIMSDEDLKKKIEELKNKPDNGVKPPEPTKSDHANDRFAEKAGCTPEQAAEFLRALQRVRAIKNERGISISELLKEEWDKIRIARKIEKMDYRGPVRQDEGDVLDDPVSAFIDIRSQEYNPTGYERLAEQVREVFDFGGINIYFSFDLSGSMSEVDMATGKSKNSVQRDVALLFLDSLMQCAYNSRRDGDDSELLPIKIMATVASDTGKTVLPLTDSWGPAEQWRIYSALKRVSRGGTPMHETMALIKTAIEEEQALLKKQNVSKDRLPLDYVVEMSDGVPDDFIATQDQHERIKRSGAVVRSYCIGGVSRSVDAAPPLTSFSELPGILAQDIVEKFSKLNPHRIKQ